MFQYLLIVVMFFLASTAAGRSPNLVVFLSDDHSYVDTALADAADFATPNLARVAADGLTLTRAFAASPSCAPSRAALLTGLMPLQNGAMFNHQRPRKKVKKLPAYLQELGYEVAAFGKVAHYAQVRRYGFDVARHFEFHDHQCIPAALEYLREWNGAKPLALFVGTNWPHVPWPDEGLGDPDKIALPPTFVDTPETRLWRTRYVAAVERFDTNLGKIYDAAYVHLGRDTVFIHFSDHGAQWPFGKWNLYDAGTRVPFVAVWPGRFPAGSTSDTMVSLVDLLPTLVELAGGEPPQDLYGRSFAGVLTGEQTEHRDKIFTTHSRDGQMNNYPMRSVRTARWKYIRNLKPAGEHHTHIDRGKPRSGQGYWTSWPRKAATDRDAASIVDSYHHRPAEELYDLQSDPYEQRDLAADPAQRQTLFELREEVDRWMRQQGDRGMATERAIAEDFFGSR